MVSSEPKLTKEEIILYMKETLNQCSLAIKNEEVPVGCVFVYLPNKKIIIRSHNKTNITQNASSHCEINCIKELQAIIVNNKSRFQFIEDNSLEAFDNIKSLLSKCALFVSCEPCIMCAYAISLINIREVYYGCNNEKFGGNGSIMSLNKGPGWTYQSKGGFLAQEAIDLLKHFFIRGNAKAPEKKRQRKLIETNITNNFI